MKKIFRLVRNAPRHPLQDFKCTTDLMLTHLGSRYGGWTFVNNESLYGSTIISAGLGEDASFEIEFAARYGARVIMVDPTPRAIQHFKLLTARLGKSRNLNYEKSGRQSIESYDLSQIGSDQLKLIDKALWNEATNLKFFSPPNPNYVSHSILNYQNNYSDDTPFIEVESITMDAILAAVDIKIEDLVLLKLDIEGAEIEVLNDCFSKGIMPKQILIEFDELNSPSTIGFRRVTDIHTRLLKKGYRLVHADGKTNFLYLRN